MSLIISQARFLWLVDILEIEPDDLLLEIGCGAGLAVEQIATKLNHGMVTAIDRSPRMIARAMIRNEKHVKAKTARFLVTDLAAFESADLYDKIFAFNVNFFWTWKSIQREADIIRSQLAKRGRLYLFYQPPSDSGTAAIASTVGTNLVSHGFELVNSLHEQSLRSCCVISRPGPTM